MNFPFYCSKVIPTDQNGFAILEASNFDRNSSIHYLQLLSLISIESKEYIAQILDNMGEASSIAQGLRTVITTYSKFVSSSDNKIYMKIENNKVCGILKTGKKNLFHYDGFGKVKELKPLCVLDFYVHESVQRLGVGKFLFEKMLQNENIKPNKLAYDRPSPKLLAFLKKHYDLSSYVPQNNNFVIYNAFWDESYTTPTGSKASSSVVDQQNFKPISQQKERVVIPENKTHSTDFHKVGRSILANPHNNNLLYSQTDRFTPTIENNQASNSYPNFYSKNSTIEQQQPVKNNNPYMSYGIQQQQSYQTKAPSYMPMHNQQPQQVIQEPKMPTYETPKYPYSRPPWGGYGVNLDSYKSSLAYGNYYNQANNNFPTGRRK